MCARSIARCGCPAETATSQRTFDVLGVAAALGVALAHFALAPLSSLTGEMLFSRGLQLDPSSVVLPLLLFPVLSTLSASIPVMLGLRGGLVHALKTA